jgi:DNA repair exonuclease SbcCD ATPase subunit
MIIFKTLRYKNFLSTGNYFTEIDIDKVPKTIVRGVNGAGKSTMLDALCFVLFNKPFRNINKPQLVSSVNQRDMVVEIEFSANQVDYKIVRGIKPNIFEIYQNGTLLNQDADAKDYQAVIEQSILKMNMKSFAQIVVLGSASFTPFMQLPTPKRREVIEDLLDIQVFTAMNVLLKKRIDANKEAVKDLKYEMDLLEGKIDSATRFNESIRVRNEDELSNLRAKIEDFNQDIDSMTDIIADMQDRVTALLKQMEDVGYSDTKLNKLKTLENQLNTKVKGFQKEIKFYSENDNCPTCKQSIESHFKADEITDRECKVKEIQDSFELLNQEIDTANSKLKQVSDIQKEISKLQLDIAKENASIAVLRKSADSTQRELDVATKRQKSEDLVDVAILNKDLNNKHDQQTANFEDREVLSVASSLLKDGGIKAAIIKQYIPVINSLANKYLEKLEFFVNFELDENFSETIKSRHRDVFSYASFSEGEKAKIDLALLMTWRDVSRLRSSMSTNLLILDEVFDGSLDSSGSELLMEIFSSLGETTNIFVISHKNDQLSERFDRTITFEKEKGFSRIKEDK